MLQNVSIVSIRNKKKLSNKDSRIRMKFKAKLSAEEVSNATALTRMFNLK